MAHFRRAELFSSIVLAALALAALIVLACPAAASAQAKKPISKDGLVKAVRINGLSTAELVGEIQTRGVAFEMTPDAEAELRRREDLHRRQQVHALRARALHRRRRVAIGKSAARHR